MKESIINLISKLDVVNPNIDRVMNNKKVADHHAIKIFDDKISKTELNILKFIKMKLIVAVSLNYVYEKIIIKASLKIELDKKEEMIFKFSKLNRNEKYFTKVVERIEGFVSSPKQFTEDALYKIALQW